MSNHRASTGSTASATSVASASSELATPRRSQEGATRASNKARGSLANLLSEKDQAFLNFRRNSIGSSRNRRVSERESETDIRGSVPGTHVAQYTQRRSMRQSQNQGRRSMMGSARISRRGSHDGVPLNGSNWDWKTDGVTTDSSLKLLEHGQVSWNFGSAQGYWKVSSDDLLMVSVNSVAYTLELHDENKHATVLKPLRNPKPKMSRQAPTITYQIETEETAGSITFKQTGRFRMSTDGREGNFSVHRNVMRLEFETGGIERVSSFDLGINFTGEQYVVFKMDCAEPPLWWTHNFEGNAELSPCPALQFVDNPWFQAGIGTLIMVNILTMAGETDFPGWCGWPYFNNFFLLVFTIELLLRIVYGGLYFFAGKDKWWHALDSVIIGLGIFDFVCDASFRHGQKSGSATGSLDKQSSLLRILRLLRLLRLLRVFNLFPSMGAFLQALWEMLNKFGMIFAVLFFFIFCSAIILTRTLGKLQEEDDSANESMDTFYSEEEARVHHKFSDVWTSWFTLFQVTTTDNWDLIASPIVNINPLWRLFFVIFIVFASWVLISVLTAVASDSMIAMTSDKREFERKEQEKRHASFIRFLKECFLGADEDGNGVLDREEFVKLMGQDRVIKEMRALGIALTQEEFLKAWEMLDIDNSGELTIDEFVSGLSYLHEALCTKHVVNIDYSLKRVSARLDQRIDGLLDEMLELRRQNNDIIDCMVEQEQMAKHQSLSLWLWQQWVQSEGGPECANHAPEMGLPTTSALELFMQSQNTEHGRATMSDAGFASTGLHSRDTSRDTKQTGMSDQSAANREANAEVEPLVEEPMVGESTGRSIKFAADT